MCRSFDQGRTADYDLREKRSCTCYSSFLRAIIDVYSNILSNVKSRVNCPFDLSFADCYRLCQSIINQVDCMGQSVSILYDLTPLTLGKTLICFDCLHSVNTFAAQTSFAFVFFGIELFFKWQFPCHSMV